MMSEHLSKIIDDLRQQANEAAEFFASVEFLGPEFNGDDVASWPNKADTQSMDDKDVRRLEDRIEASNEAAQLRLDAVMARIDGRFETIANTLAELKSGQAGIKSDLKTEMAETRATSRTWGMWAAGTALAAGLGIGALLIGMKQVWIGGVQVGQAISSSPKP